MITHSLAPLAHKEARAMRERVKFEVSRLEICALHGCVTTFRGIVGDSIIIPACEECLMLEGIEIFNGLTPAEAAKLPQVKREEKGLCY